MDLAPVGAALTLVVGAALSVGGGYAARRREDIRSRRIDILTTYLPEVHWAKSGLRDMLTVRDVDTQSRYDACLRFERATAKLSAMAVSCSPSDADRGERLRMEGIAVRDLHGFLDQAPTPRPEDAMARVLVHLDAVGQQIDEYLSWLQARINHWL